MDASDALPSIATRLSNSLRRWRLASRGQLAGGFSAAVYRCVSHDGNEVVVKLPPNPDLALTEVAALRLWSNSGTAVRLVDFSRRDFALLLPQIEPATHLPANEDDVAVEVVADILGALHAIQPMNYPFRSFVSEYLAWEKRALRDIAYERQSRREPERAQPAFERLPAARRAAMYLSSTAKGNVLLHGDLVDKNLLWDGARYLAIDPIPRIGDPCSDVGFFAAGHQPVAGILERAAAIATRLGLSPRRAQQWAAVWTVHQTCQAWRDDQHELDALTAGGEVDNLLKGDDR